MAIATSYNLRVPKDAIVAIQTEGILGQGYLDIDVSQASGLPIENYGYLKSKPTNPPPSVDSLLKALDLTTALVEASKATEKSTKNNTASPCKPPKP